MTPRTKKLLNDPEDAVRESLAGFAAAHADLVRVDVDRQIVLRRTGPVPGKVGVLSGGGSGHEPLHAGFVGPGMLDAAVPGSVFTSPPPDTIVEATRAIETGAGVLYIVKNYTGDVMNFRLAAHEAAAAGIDVEVVLVDDDVAVDDSLFTAGRRGTGATVLVERLAGASAERGDALAAVTRVANRVNESSRSYGVALTSCSTPALGRPSFELGEDEIELGVGIHGEPGRRRGRMTKAADLVAEMVESVVADLRPVRGADVLALVNGLGATPLLELYVVYNDVVAELQRRGLRIVRSLVGNYVTSLDMAGVSLTLLLMDEELVELWDAPVCTVGLRRGM